MSETCGDVTQSKPTPPTTGSADRRESGGKDTESASDEENCPSDVFRKCEEHLSRISTCTGLQQTIHDEIKKQAKFDSIVYHKMASKSRRLLHHANCLEQAGTSGWMCQAIVELSGQVMRQAEAHRQLVSTLSRQCKTIQHAIDGHHHLLSSVHTKTDPSSGDKPLPTERDVIAHVGDSRNRQERVNLSFREACEWFENIRTSRRALINKMEYLKAQQQKTDEQICQTRSTSQNLRTTCDQNTLPWSMQLKIQDCESRADFLASRKEQVVTDLTSTSQELQQFDLDVEPTLLLLVRVFELHQDSHDSSLRNGFHLLKAVSLRDRHLLEQFQQHPTHAAIALDGEEICDVAKVSRENNVLSPFQERLQGFTRISEPTSSKANYFEQKSNVSNTRDVKDTLLHSSSNVCLTEKTENIPVGAGSERDSKGLQVSNETPVATELGCHQRNKATMTAELGYHDSDKATELGYHQSDHQSDKAIELDYHPRDKATMTTELGCHQSDKATMTTELGYHKPKDDLSPATLGEGGGDSSMCKTTTSQPERQTVDLEQNSDVESVKSDSPCHRSVASESSGCRDSNINHFHYVELPHDLNPGSSVRPTPRRSSMSTNLCDRNGVNKCVDVLDYCHEESLQASQDIVEMYEGKPTEQTRIISRKKSKAFADQNSGINSLVGMSCYRNIEGEVLESVDTNQAAHIENEASLSLTLKSGEEFPREKSDSNTTESLQTEALIAKYADSSVTGRQKHIPYKSEFLMNESRTASVNKEPRPRDPLASFDDMDERGRCSSQWVCGLPAMSSEHSQEYDEMRTSSLLGKYMWSHRKSPYLSKNFNNSEFDSSNAATVALPENGDTLEFEQYHKSPSQKWSRQKVKVCAVKPLTPGLDTYSWSTESDGDKASCSKGSNTDEDACVVTAESQCKPWGKDTNSQEQLNSEKTEPKQLLIQIKNTKDSTSSIGYTCSEHERRNGEDTGSINQSAVEEGLLCPLSSHCATINTLLDTSPDLPRIVSSAEYPQTVSFPEYPQTVNSPEHLQSGNTPEYLQTGSSSAPSQSGCSVEHQQGGSSLEHLRSGSSLRSLQNGSASEHLQAMNSWDYNQTGSSLECLAKTGSSLEHPKSGSFPEYPQSGNSAGCSHSVYDEEDPTYKYRAMCVNGIKQTQRRGIVVNSINFENALPRNHANGVVYGSPISQSSLKLEKEVDNSLVSGIFIPQFQKLRSPFGQWLWGREDTIDRLARINAYVDYYDYEPMPNIGTGIRAEGYSPLLSSRWSQVHSTPLSTSCSFLDACYYRSGRFDGIEHEQGEGADGGQRSKKRQKKVRFSNVVSYDTP
ncbi:uncharacterized protein LOC106013436 [Aplysia californica]|uniref:Uncharacterized protein LOC106013436 n=1 Tax=Aplysia californica TaxID=6500 RepID=A0ABM1ABQ1_APLCA|nr:uncharacterized protein LOC106013436 [Aplysia californica]